MAPTRTGAQPAPATPTGSPRAPRTRTRAPRRAPALPLAALVAEFLDEVDQTLAAGTYRAYKVPLALYLRHLRGLLDREPTLDDLTVETARAWIAHLRTTPKRQNAGRDAGDRPIAPASLRNYLTHLRAFAGWLAKPPQSYCPESALKHLKLPRAEETPKVPAEPEALQRLLRRAAQETDTVLGARGRALVLVLVDGGLRAAEIANLAVADVSLKDGILLVRRAKGKRPRLVAVGDAACLLHDVGKVYTLPEMPGAALPESALAADHVTRGALLVHAAAARLDPPLPSPERLERLTHAILAHHGRKEWGAPVEPHTAEAWLVHLADYAESHLDAWAAGAAP